MMTKIMIIHTALGMLRYRATLSGEKLGWVIHESASTFSPFHQVLGDPNYGPVIIVGGDVYEIDLDGEVYATEALAREAYYNK